MSKFKEVRTRFAPSPSGYLHVGGARTALFNYLYARSQGGKFIIRVEDTDQERSTPESERIILDSLKWLGMHADEGVDEGGDYGPYRQSERIDLYAKYTEKLLESGAAFRCFCTSEELEAKQQRSREMGVPHVYDGKCRGLTPEEIDARLKAGEKYAVRFRVNAGEIIIEDVVQGRVKFDARLIGDFIIVKSDGFPSYNYAVVIDDHLMQISHVIRGVGHLSNTPRQVLIHEQLGFELPTYAHISEIVGTDKKKLSKRRGATSVLFFNKLGYLSEAFTNYMALLGWYPSDANEFIPDGGLEKKFTIERCSKSPAMFDFFNTVDSEDDFSPESLSREELEKLINKKSKLIWLNNKYIRNLPLERVWEEALPFVCENEKLAALQEKDPALLSRTFDRVRIYISNLQEVTPYLLEIFKDDITPLPDAREVLQAKEAQSVVRAFSEVLRSDNPAEPDEFKECMMKAGESCQAKGGKLFMPIRCASTGSKRGLELPILFSILGAETIANRIDAVLNGLDS